MNSKKYTWLLYLIITTIVISIGTQIFFNYKNYQKNKQQFINDVQISLDNATDLYYSELIKTAPIFDTLSLNTTLNKNSSSSNLTVLMNANNQELKDSLSLSLKNKSSNKKDNEITVYIFDGKFKDKSKIKMDWNSFDNKKTNPKSNFKFSKRKATDSIKFIRNISKLFNSISNNSLEFTTLDSLVKTELNRKKIQLNYQLNHYKFNKIVAFNKKIDTLNTIKTLSKSVYLKRNEKVELIYPNQTKKYLKKGFLGILLSFLLSTAIISSLFYLLYIIKKQKQLAEIKNDFISNITHEFKTPITTIGLATNSIKEFIHQKNYNKTNEYLSITKNQLNKLQLMVEKVLETSILDQDELHLEKTPIDVVKLIYQIVEKHRLNSTKSILFKTDAPSILLVLDSFHFENAINNLIDNAIKYGGDLIEIRLKSFPKTIEIFIKDNGRIDKVHQDKLFDKFYRIPQGNTHNVKGFGIGLYYTKKIIEKHQGSIILTDDNQTSFKITLVK